MHNDKQAYQLLLSDMVENILRYSDNPGNCATYVTSQIRELVGVRMVAIISEDGSTDRNVITTCPPRHAENWNKPKMQELATCLKEFDVSQVIPLDSAAGKVLTTESVGTSFVIPLKVGDQRVGVLVLLDLLDLRGAAIILDALQRISSIVALILRNSFLYKNMENTVAVRTAQLAKSEQLFRALFEQASDGIFFLDTAGNVVSVNESFARLHGYTVAEMLELGIRKLDVEGVVSIPERVRRILDGETLTFTVEHYHKDGHIFPLEVTSNLISIGDEKIIIAIHRDIAERIRAEEDRLALELQRQQTQKLESLGVLAGGIAHDFNNLMGGIFGYIDLANEEPDKRKISTYLSKAMTTIDRARGLTGQLLTFAKGGAPLRKIGSLFPFVQEAAQFALSGSNISCDFDVPKDLWPCNFDRNQIGQVIDNLVINAQQAMPFGGTIEVSARNMTVGENKILTLVKGSYVRISVKDSGVGMSRELLTRIFDPFFTTKTTGHGLGLATCYSIVSRHGGCITVESEMGKGSTFHVYLPASADSVLSDSPAVENVHKGQGTFLVMDDEEVMRDTIGAMLQTLGYSAVCKNNGRDAVDFFIKENNAGTAFTGLIFDLTIPGGMGGKAAVNEIRKLEKGATVPVFVASGYAEDPIMKNPAAYGFTASICKPFRTKDLSEMLNRHLKKE